MAKLIVRAADGTTSEFPLDEKGSATLGRSPECDIPLQDSNASRRHATVIRLQSGYEVSDLGSTNGTLVNGQLVKKQKLRHGDVIRIGAVEATFVDESQAAAGAAPMQNCFLVFAKGDRRGEKFELTQPRTTIGRKETNTLALKDNVASSYHCEIVRNLNGYVIRDLGSTNGTLLNGETVTEGQLTHGAKIRVGNTRFVFQDPAMAEVDLELTGVEDEESEWGMMRELDLQAVRRRNPANLVYLLLFVVLLGGGFYLVKFQPGKRADGPESPANNLHDGYSFETAGAAWAWDSEPPGALDASITEAKKVSGAASLEIKSRNDGGEFLYGSALEGQGTRYHVTGQIAAQGATASLGIQWRGLGVTRWATAPAEGGSFRKVDFRTTAPPWARSASLGVLVRGQGTVWLDDVVVLREAAADAQPISVGSFSVAVTDAASLDIASGGAPLLPNGEGAAFNAAGEEIAGTRGTVRIAVEKVDEAHLAIALTQDGAEKSAFLGIVFDSAGAYLAEGFRAFGVREDGETYFESDAPEKPLAGVRKLLVGPKGKAIAVLGGSDEARFHTAVRKQADGRSWSIAAEPREGTARLRLKLDLSGESKFASDRILAARDLERAGRLGDFLEEGQRVLAEFPFAPEGMKKELDDALKGAQQRFEALAKEAQEQLRDYEAFKDQQSLVRVREILKIMETRFQAGAGEGPRAQRYRKIAESELDARGKAMKALEQALAGPLLDQALLIHLPDGEVCSAAVLLHFITNDLPQSPQAKNAREELDKLRASHPDVVAVLERLAKG